MRDQHPCWARLLPVQSGIPCSLSDMYRFLVAVALVLSAWLSSSAQAESGGLVNGQPYREYSTVDKLTRNITFYVSEPQAPDEKVPLVVYVQGTGCTSHFLQREGRVFTGLHGLVHKTFRGRARVAIVEKPGVEPFDDQGERSMQEFCRPEFFYEHTLDLWSEAIAAAIRSAQTFPGIDDSSTLVVGISEGGMVAIRVSSILPNVTHAASLAGGGPNHMYVYAEFLRRRGLDPEELVYDCWRDVQWPTTTRMTGALPHKV